MNEQKLTQLIRQMLIILRMTLGEKRMPGESPNPIALTTKNLMDSSHGSWAMKRQQAVKSKVSSMKTRLNCHQAGESEQFPLEFVGWQLMNFIAVESNEEEPIYMAMFTVLAPLPLNQFTPGHTTGFFMVGSTIMADTLHRNGYVYNFSSLPKRGA